MSLVKTYSVFCDVNIACVGNWVAQTTDGAAEARAEARMYGWKRIDGKDWCPACLASAPAAVAGAPTAPRQTEEPG